MSTGYLAHLLSPGQSAPATIRPRRPAMFAPGPQRPTDKHWTPDKQWTPDNAWGALGDLPDQSAPGRPPVEADDRVDAETTAVLDARDVRGAGPVGREQQDVAAVRRGQRRRSDAPNGPDTTVQGANDNDREQPHRAAAIRPSTPEPVPAAPSQPDDGTARPLRRGVEQSRLENGNPGRPARSVAAPGADPTGPVFGADSPVPALQAASASPKATQTISQHPDPPGLAVQEPDRDDLDGGPDRPSAPWRETPEQPGKSRGDEARPHVDINDTCRDVRPAQTSLPRSDQPVVGTGATQTPPMGSPPAASSAPDAHPPAPTAALRHPHVDHRTPLRRPLSDEDRPRNLAPSGWRSAAGAAATPDIHITIGRIEIRAQTVQSPRQPAQPEASHVDLDTYLSARTAGLRS